MNPRAFIVDGNFVEPPPHLQVSNFNDPTVQRFRGRERPAKNVREVIVHESVTRSVETTVAVLKKRKLGVHLIVGPDGKVTQHADLARARLSHAGVHNARSIGIEAVNPYYPSTLKPGRPWSTVINAPWAHKKKYVLPTPAQAESTALLIAWLTSPASRLAIPRRWIGLQRGKLSMSALTGAENPAPGIYAHHYFAHADGSWLVLYAWMRLVAGLSPEVAYREAKERARGAKSWVDLFGLVDPEKQKE
jgi:hypothetical protein